MNCPICHDIIVDEAYAKCEWCRYGAPMEAALEGPSFSPEEGRRKLSEAMSAPIMDALRRQGAARSLLPVQQVDLGIKAAVDFHANHPFSPSPPPSSEVIRQISKFAKALPSALGIPPSFMGFATWKNDSTLTKYENGWEKVFGEKK